MKALMAKIACHFLGHDPDLSKCQRVTIEGRTVDYGLLVVEFVGRYVYFGATNCKRCGKEMEVKP